MSHRENGERKSYSEEDKSREKPKDKRDVTDEAVTTSVLLMSQ